MTSQVNPNNIDGTYPVAGQDNDSQGFRDNFTNIRNNLTYVKAEIEDLQNKVVLKSALSNSTLDNDFAGNIIANPSFTAWRETYNNIGSTSGTVTINFANGNFQKLTMAGSVTLIFSFPTSTNNQYSSVKLWISNPNSGYTITLPTIVTLGDPDTIAGLSGTNPPIITFNASEIANNTEYLFEFFTVDGGATIGIKDLVRNRDIDLSGLQISGNLNLDNITASGNVVTTNGIFWAGNGNPFIPALTTLSTSGVLTAGGNIVAASGTDSTSSTTGALVVVGGAGVSANVNIDGNLFVNSGNIRSTGTVSNIFNISMQTISMGNAATNIFMGVSTGNVTVGGNIIAGANSRAASFVPTSTSIPAYGIYNPGANQIGFSTNYTPNWLINASGTFLPQTDNTFDIGNGTVNPRDITASRIVLAKGNIVAASSQASTSTTSGALVVVGGAGIAGNLNLGSGSTSVVPLAFAATQTTGGNVNVPIQGAVEANIGVGATGTSANVFYVTPTNATSSGRALIPAAHTFVLGGGNVSIFNAAALSGAAQANIGLFSGPVAANGWAGNVMLAAGTTYEVEVFADVEVSAAMTSSTVQFIFAGNATTNFVNYDVTFVPGRAAGATPVVTKFWSLGVPVTTAAAVSAATTTKSFTVRAKGLISINGQGTLTQTIAFGTSQSTQTAQTVRGSYMKWTPIGTASNIAIGTTMGAPWGGGVGY